MKWIGQHIWDLISRFRSDVYLDDVTAGTVAATDFLGVDSAGKIVKTTGGAGGGISEEYLASRGENLITNYSGLLGTNYNFPDFTFDGAYSNSSPGSFSITGNSPGSVRTSEFMVVNANKKYKVSVDIKTLHGLGRYYMFTDCYDVDDNLIASRHHMYLTGTTTTLAVDLSPGDTEIHLTDASNWYNTGTAGVAGHDRSLLVWGYENSYGHEYPIHTYSRLLYRGPNHATSGYSEDLWTPGSVNTTTNIITLREAWTGPEYKAGRDVSNGDAGATYKYNVMDAFTPSNQVWSHKTGYMDGIDYTGNNVSSKFNPGTAKVKVGFLPNYRNADDVTNNESWVMEETAWVTNLFFGLDYSSSELIIDEDDMASNLDDFVPSQQSVKAYVDTEVALKASLTGADFTGDINTTASVKLHYGSSDYGKFYANSEGFNFDTEANRHVIFKKVGVETMRIDTSGNMGVGIASPTERLHVSGNAIISGDLTISGGDISLSGTGRIQGIDTVTDSTDATNKAYVDAAVSTNTDTQDLSISGQVLSLTNGGSVTLPDTDTQNLSISGQTLSLTNGGSVTLPSGGGGGSISINTSGSGLGEDDMTSVTTINFVGDDIQVFDQGSGVALINISDTPLATASNFYIASNPVGVGGAGLASYNIATPSASRMFNKGNLSSSTQVKVTDGDLTFSTSSQRGNMLNSTVVVTVYGPDDNVSSGSTNVLGEDGSTGYTFAYPITGSNTSAKTRGITIQASSYVLDAWEPQRKAVISVTFDPSFLAPNGVNDNGSQLYKSIKIEHKSNDLVDTYGTVFNSASFFYDNDNVSPSAPASLTLSFSGSSTKYLSNVKFYDDRDAKVNVGTVTDWARDTYTSGGGAETVLSGKFTSKTQTLSFANTGNADDNASTAGATTALKINQWGLGANGVSYYCSNVDGGFATDYSNNTLLYGGAANYNSYSGTNTATGEFFRDETRRMYEDSTTWRSTGSPNLTAYRVSSTNGLNNSSIDYAVQTNYSGSTFKLAHPVDVSNPNGSPSQDRGWSTPSKVAGATAVDYFRVFTLASAASVHIFDLGNYMTRTQVAENWTSGKFKMWMCRIGAGSGTNGWMAINPGAEWESGNGNLWHGSQPSNQNHIKVNFDGTTSYIGLKILIKDGHAGNLVKFSKV